MPKREHITSQSYIDWLKSMGCVFYAPLDQDNGLKDLISGVVGTTQQGTATYNSTEQAYYIEKNSSTYSSAVVWNNLNLDIPRSGNVSLSALLEIKPTYGQYAQGNNIGRCFLYQCLKGRWSATNMDNLITKNQWNKMAMCVLRDGTSNSYQYRNGTVVYSWGVLSQITWQSQPSSIFTGMELESVSWGGMYENTKGYYRNLMFFNRQLSQQEVKIIQQIQ